ncbi:MAG: OmpA family protein [Candidatus Magnetomorum sp.]|nr:OmpA family protein [Candidatus Magnetomorum sp.]
MSVKQFRLLWILFLAIGVTGCQIHLPEFLVNPIKSIKAITSSPSCKGIKTDDSFDSFEPVIIKGPYIQRTDHVMFILDASLSMATNMHGENKLKYAKQIINRINLTMPKMHIHSSLRTFGNTIRPAIYKTELVYGPELHSRQALGDALRKIKKPGGMSALHQALLAVKNDFKNATGHISIIVVTDGKVMGPQARQAVLSLKKDFGKRISIYPITVENKPSPSMETMVKEAGQGFVERADAIFSPEDMATYVNKVFLSRIHHQDKDGDGITDDIDKCPNTPAGARVTINGCWVIGNIHFKSDSWNVPPEMNPYLDEIVAILENNPNLWMEVQGHTDYTGTSEHNYSLSKNRAKAVMNYLIHKGISADRLTSTGYAATKPIESNKTEEGKALNRRVELKPLQN